MKEHQFYSAFIDTLERATSIQWFRAFGNYAAPELDQYGTVFVNKIHEKGTLEFNRVDNSFQTTEHGTLDLLISVYNRNAEKQYPSETLSEVKQFINLDEEICPVELGVDDYAYSLHSMGSIINSTEYRNSVNQPRSLLTCKLWWQELAHVKAVDHIEHVQGLEYITDDLCSQNDELKNIRDTTTNTITFEN